MSATEQPVPNTASVAPFVMEVIQDQQVVGSFQVEDLERQPPTAPGDTIVHLTFEAAAPITLQAGTDSLFFSGGPGSGSAISSAILSVSETPVDGIWNFEVDVATVTTTRGFEYACFATGTRISTTIGAVAVEHLQPGDVVTTLAGPAEVTWIGRRRACDTDVIRVRAGTLGAARDLIVSDDHALHLDGCLVPAGLLVDGEGIVRERRDEVTFWHVELERHAILLAEGVEAESYLDTGNRGRFANCPLAYEPVQATQDPCAEMVFAGSRLERIRRMLRMSETI